jgi:hypothetical protein
MQMAKQTNTKGNTGNRYTEAKKQEILAFIEKHGRGAISAAQERYGVSYIAIASWKAKYGFGAKSMKKVLAQVPAKRGRPAKVLSNRPGRPSTNSAPAKLVAGLRAVMNKAETKLNQLESMLQPA